MNRTEMQLLAFLTLLESQYGYSQVSRTTYPERCSFCSWRDTFRIDKEKAGTTCYKYDDILAQCGRYKNEPD